MTAPITAGATVRWRKEYTKGDNAPMGVLAVLQTVKVDGGSHISASMLEVVTPGPDDPQEAAGDSEDLLPVIETQLEAIDELRSQLDDLPAMVSDLCVALGFASIPRGSTGIRELDALIEEVFP